MIPQKKKNSASFLFHWSRKPKR